MFLEVDAKPARGCWHELLKKNLPTFVTFGNFLRLKGRELLLYKQQESIYDYGNSWSITWLFVFYSFLNTVSHNLFINLSQICHK